MLTIVAVAWFVIELLRLSAHNQWRALRSMPKPNWTAAEWALIVVAVMIGGFIGPHLLASRTSSTVESWGLGGAVTVAVAACLFTANASYRHRQLSGVAAVSKAVFDELIHAPLRLQICAMLAPVQSLAFADIRDSLEISDSVLSKHLSALADAGYVVVSRVRADSRSRRQVALTKLGRTALRGHLTALQAIASLAEPAMTENTSGAPSSKRQRARRKPSLDPRTA